MFAFSPVSKPYKCQQCEKTFTQSSNLKVNVQIHNTEESFEGHHCNKLFVRKRNLKAHLRSHTEKKIINANIVMNYVFQIKT